MLFSGFSSPLSISFCEYTERVHFSIWHQFD